MRTPAILTLSLLLTVPVVGQITSMNVNVQTSTAGMAGTDDDVELVLIVSGPSGIQERAWNLDNDADNFEQGQLDGFPIGGNLPARACDIKAIAIRKSPDDSNGGWRLAWFQIFINGQLFHTSNVGQWLEDDHRSWGDSSFQPVMCPPPPVPPGITLPEVKPPDDCTVITFEGSGEFQTQVESPDADCDKIADKDDQSFDPPDSDGDGLCDRCEDFDGDGVVDPGETDPGKQDTDNLPDSDQDCLADIFEDTNHNGGWDAGAGESNAHDSDSDDDGWLDGSCNVRTQLFLLRIECLNEQEDVGSDELFLTFNHARRPSDGDLDGSWSLEGGDTIAPLLEVARRTRGNGQKATFSVRMDVREEDTADFWDDDFDLDHDFAFTENQNLAIDYNDDGFFDTTAYRFHFSAISDWFADPSPLNAGADGDNDGLTEKVEFTTGSLLAGMSDPAQPDIYMELDSAGKDQLPERYTREDIASRFTDHGFAFHLDDGVFGGGQILAEEDEVTLRGPDPSVTSLRKTSFFPNRCGVFHYVLAVDVVKVGNGKKFGQADRVIKDGAGNTLCGFGDILLFKSDFLDHVSDLESIVWIHEFGHNLGLCHLPGDPEETATGKNGCTTCKSGCDCAHYSNTTWNDSAMGSGFSFPWVDDMIQAIDREVDYDTKEWAAIDLRPIANTQSCP